MTAVVDYGMGNLLSVVHALEFLGSDAQIVNEPAELRLADRIILPGVGAFRDCLATLRRTGFAEALSEQVVQGGKPFLGICLGMQAIATRGYEGGEHAGLGWLAADVVRLSPNDSRCRVPHVGWNAVTFDCDDPLFAGVPVGADFYFVHSYQMQCMNEAVVTGRCEHGGPVTAAVRWRNIAAVQFHPEKSQDHGLRVLENFLGWRP